MGRSLALDDALPCKNKRQRGSAGASPLTAPMPKSVSFLWGKINCLEGECVAYLSLMGWPGIYSMYFPNLMVIRSLSHWMGYSLPILIADLIRDIEGAIY